MKTSPKPKNTNSPLSTCSEVEPLAKAFRLLASGGEPQTTDPTYVSTSAGSPIGSTLELFGGKTSPAPSPCPITLSAASWLRSLGQMPPSYTLTPNTSKTGGEKSKPSLDQPATPSGRVRVWLLDPAAPQRGAFSILNLQAWLSAANVSLLSQVLVLDVPRKYYLSPKCCAGILRRAERRGKTLPPLLEAALLEVARGETTSE